MVLTLKLISIAVAYQDGTKQEAVRCISLSFLLLCCYVVMFLLKANNNIYIIYIYNII